MKKLVTDKTLISTCTLITSLTAYYYSRADERDGVPYVMIGGFLGTWLGELIVKIKNQNKK